MRQRQALRVLHRLNELQLVERRVEAAQKRLAVTASTALCERQDGYLDYVGRRLTADGPLQAEDFRAESDRFQVALDNRALLGRRLEADEAALDVSVRECFGLERRNKTLQQVMSTRRQTEQRLEDQQWLREMDELWSQRKGQA
ncbi:hypothetical protein [Solimonas sp. SE-A11]|uniref:hypothetical protein n=1 Tax=Solimonas sp. SE-A11 TaxID=3054954 RepID=UPI00259CDA48|nr:hypothetical protein [Solimonas sp. SE-A11]MDM4772916.1 hypothetical protein [Solimonas sp. SE-A11]